MICQTQAAPSTAAPPCRSPEPWHDSAAMRRTCSRATTRGYATMSPPTPAPRMSSWTKRVRSPGCSSCAFSPTDSVAGWLWRVAVRETHRLQAVERRQQGLHEDRSEARDHIGPRHLWLEAIDSLSALRPRERRRLGLRAGGCGHREISAATGDSSRTIDRQLLRARKRLAAAR
jgi:hypothetical protein